MLLIYLLPLSCASPRMRRRQSVVTQAAGSARLQLGVTDVLVAVKVRARPACLLAWTPALLLDNGAASPTSLGLSADSLDVTPPRLTLPPCLPPPRPSQLDIGVPTKALPRCGRLAVAVEVSATAAPEFRVSGGEGKGGGGGARRNRGTRVGAAWTRFLRATTGPNIPEKGAQFIWGLMLSTPSGLPRHLALTPLLLPPPPRDFRAARARPRVPSTPPYSRAPWKEGPRARARRWTWRRCASKARGARGGMGERRGVVPCPLVTAPLPSPASAPQAVIRAATWDLDASSSSRLYGCPPPPPDPRPFAACRGPDVLDRAPRLRGADGRRRHT